MRRRLRYLIIGLAFFALNGCGFQLRGTTNIPFKTLYISVSDTSPVAVGIKREIRGNGPTVLVTDPNKAEARLEILGESLRSDILTINSEGLAAEYNLYYRLRFRVTDNKGHSYIPPTVLLLKRLVLANSNAILAENFEITQLVADMQSDAAQQLLRRLEAIKPGQFVVDLSAEPSEDGSPAPIAPMLNQPITPLNSPGISAPGT